VIEPHFHPIDQFQIFVRGTDLKLGKHVCEPVAVHYTDGYTPYGPITWGEGGMAFFNLRARADTGAHWMPGSREKLARRAGRSETVHCGLADPATAQGAEQQVLIAEHDDGLFAFGMVAGPGVELPEDVVGGAGRYELVLAGELELEDETLPAHSLLFVSAGDRLPARRAGAAGAHVLTVQSPTS
jgi:hypothetical protein